jgi:hypothetical protein
MKFWSEMPSETLLKIKPRAFRAELWATDAAGAKRRGRYKGVAAVEVNA